MRPDSTDWYGRFRFDANARNDFRIDRDKQRGGKSYTGIPSVSLEDHAVTESMGPIYDRTSEHLGRLIHGRGLCGCHFVLVQNHDQTEEPLW